MELSILRNYQQTPNKIIKNQGENKNRKNTFDSHQFIHFIADSAISDRAFFYCRYVIDKDVVESFYK